MTAKGGCSKKEFAWNKLSITRAGQVGMRKSLSFLLITIVCSACATSEEREVAALKRELGLDVAPYFPKCLSEEVSPRAAVRAGDYNIAHTVNNPQGNVAIDRCARWETDEPNGPNAKEPQKIDLRHSDKKKREKENPEKSQRSREGTIDLGH